MAIAKKQEIINLFENYKYNLLTDREDILVFEYASGMYSAVEIVPIVDRNTNKEAIEKIIEEYSHAGYATHLYDTCDLDLIKRNLFNGFFQTKLSNKRIKNKYNEYCERVMMQYGKPASDYQYIEVPYEKERDFKLENTNDRLVDSIYSLLQENGARLIILEAPAGFGKTSTTYEVLNRFQNIDKDVRPFLMELYKDRTASIFKYILLSNIDRDFDVSLKSDIVIENIKAGRIPLLVDGFDELLSKDINNKKKIEFKEVESMLSTIAELLNGNAKIMLTSRKTAIFSGEEFFEWYDNLIAKGLDFHIVRYSINNPTISDWLDNSLIQNYGKSLLAALNNPVLLGFIRYCGNDMSGESTSMVDKFFDLLLNREIQRQSLPFSVVQQKEIMRRLALTMACFNCSSDTRAWIMNLIEETSKELILSKVTAVRDMESLLNSLANHALLNRKNEKIGFLNDFIYGVMMAEGFLHYSIDDHYEIIDTKEIASKYIDKCIKAAAFLENENKRLVWRSLKQNTLMDEVGSVLCDWKLVGECDSTVKDQIIDGELLTKCTFGTKNNIIDNCTFSNMEFQGCTFNFDYIERCTFVKCKFDNCIKKGKNHTCYDYGCYDPDSILEITEEGLPIVHEVLSDNEIKTSILQKYFMVGSQRRRMKLVSIIRKEYTENEKQFKRCLDSLESNKYLIINGDKSFITDEGIQWLQSIQ